MKDDLSERALKTIFTEINALKALKSHPHIVKLLDYDQSEYTKSHKSERKFVNYIVIELAGGGELFNIISQTGRFEEEMARYYFR